MCSFRTAFPSFIAQRPGTLGMPIRSVTCVRSWLRVARVKRSMIRGDGTPKKREARIEAVIPA